MKSLCLVLLLAVCPAALAKDIHDTITRTQIRVIDGRQWEQIPNVYLLCVDGKQFLLSGTGYLTQVYEKFHDGKMPAQCATDNKQRKQ